MKFRTVVLVCFIASSWLTRAVFRTKSDLAITSSVVFAIFLWGGNNTGVKYIVADWPPIWTGGTRFVCAGVLMLLILHRTNWLGTRPHPLTPELNRALWLHGGLSLAVYIACFNYALRYTSASHVALYLCASPVWALFLEEWPARNWRTLQRYGAAMLALAGVFVLFWPALCSSSSHWYGEVLGLSASILWTHFGRQCRVLGAKLSGAEVSAHTMWRAGVIMLPPGLIEIARTGFVLHTDLVLVQVYCIIAGGVAAFAMWNNALRHWPTSQVMLFNNLIPLSTMTWAHFCLGERVTSTFWLAMVLIVSGVTLGQINWQRLMAPAAIPPE